MTDPLLAELAACRAARSRLEAELHNAWQEINNANSAAQIAKEAAEALLRERTAERDAAREAITAALNEHDSCRVLMFRIEELKSAKDAAEAALRAKVEQWREKQHVLARKADAQGMTQYALRLGERSEQIAECADQLAQALASRPEQEDDMRVGGGEPCKHGVVITQAVCYECLDEDKPASSLPSVEGLREKAQTLRCWVHPTIRCAERIAYQHACTFQDGHWVNCDNCRFYKWLTQALTEATGERQRTVNEGGRHATDCASTLTATPMRGCDCGTKPVGDGLRTQLDRAHKELCDAVERQWNGKPAFRLSIPAAPDSDTDLIISAALHNAIEALTEALPIPQVDLPPDAAKVLRDHAWELLESEAPRPKVGERCRARTDVFGRCALLAVHAGRHVNALGEDFSIVAEAPRPALTAKWLAQAAIDEAIYHKSGDERFKALALARRSCADDLEAEAPRPETQTRTDVPDYVQRAIAESLERGKAEAPRPAPEPDDPP